MEITTPSDSLVAALAAKHGAVSDWALDSFTSLTLERQRAIRRADGRPLAFNGFLADVWESNGAYRATVDSDWFSSSERFVLEIDSISAEQIIMARGGSFFETFAVVVHVDSVRPVQFRTDTAAIDEETVEIEVNDGNLLMAYGKLLDWQFLDD